MQKLFFYILPLQLLLFPLLGHCQSIQVNETHMPKLFSTIETPSYITLGQGFGNIEPLVWEANFSPEFQLSVKNFPNFGFLFTPQIIMRMYDQYSHPVRTPSYMPRGTLFYHFRNNTSLLNDQFIYFTLGHHSNGQDGAFYESDSITINKIDGSFASNYLLAGYEKFSNSKTQFNPFNSIRFSSAFYLISKKNPLYNLYGRLRFFADIESYYTFRREGKNLFSNNKSKSKITGNLHLGWIALNLIDAKAFDFKRLIFSYTLSYQPAEFNDIALFARYYYGQDYYNINFKRTLTNLQFGVSIRNFSFN